MGSPFELRWLSVCREMTPVLRCHWLQGKAAGAACGCRGLLQHPAVAAGSSAHARARLAPDLVFRSVCLVRVKQAARKATLQQASSSSRYSVCV